MARVCVDMQEGGVCGYSRLCALSNHDAWGRKRMRVPKTHVARGPVSIQAKTCVCACVGMFLEHVCVWAGPT